MFKNLTPRVTGQSPLPRENPVGIDCAPIKRMLSVLLGFVTAAAASFGVVAVALRRAPEAFEDEQGFHILRKRAGGSAVLARKRRAKQDHIASLRKAQSHS
jgi:hypothetical protein